MCVCNCSCSCWRLQCWLCWMWFGPADGSLDWSILCSCSLSAPSLPPSCFCWPTALAVEVNSTGVVQVKHRCLVVSACYLSGRMARGGLALRCWSGLASKFLLLRILSCLRWDWTPAYTWGAGVGHCLFLVWCLEALPYWHWRWTCPVSPGCWPWPVNVASRCSGVRLAQSQGGHSGLQSAAQLRYFGSEWQSSSSGGLVCALQWNVCGLLMLQALLLVLLLLCCSPAATAALVRYLFLLACWRPVPTSVLTLLILPSLWIWISVTAASCLLPHVYCVIVMYITCTLCWVYLLFIHKTQKGMCATLRTHPFPYFKLYNKAGDPKF